MNQKLWSNKDEVSIVLEVLRGDRGYSVRKPSHMQSPFWAVTRRRSYTPMNTTAWLRPGSGRKAIVSGIVITGCIKHCSRKACGIMLR